MVRVEYADRDEGTFLGMARSLKHVSEVVVGAINGVYGPVGL